MSTFVFQLNVVNPVVGSSVVNTSVTQPQQTEAFTGMQVEIPFVPQVLRQPKREFVDDMIVVVGQTKQKKRKRNKGDREVEKEASSPKRGKIPETVEDVEPFDFSAVPNMLDEPSGTRAEIDVKSTKVKKEKERKGKKGKRFFYLIAEPGSCCAGDISNYDFPAPPRAHNQVKSGNQSYTFK
jgi:exosome complex exonuclease RRP6